MSYPLAFLAGSPEPIEGLLDDLRGRREESARIVTAGGCFDLLHAGHLRHLEEAAALGDVLVVLLNSDASASRLKGPGRPIVPERDRAQLLGALRCVDAVVIFDEDTPAQAISLLSPAIHCKGGDYAGVALPEEEAVLAGGGETRILSRHGDVSSTALAAAMARHHEDSDGLLLRAAMATSTTAARMGDEISAAGEMVAERLAAGGKLLLCGNGGSAADAQHAASEYVGRFRTESALPALALTTDLAALTGIANDYGFERVFERQVEALGGPEDLLVGLSVSGRSPNVCHAARRARELGLGTIGITGRDPGPLAEHCDLWLGLPEDDVALVQHLQMLVLHAIAGVAERRLAAVTAS